MSEIKWIKIVTDIFDDEKILLIETLPDGDSIIVLWFKLLCLAGKQNNSGVFIMQNGMPYTDKMLSIIFRRKEATVKLALDTFQAFGMIEILENAITIPNWGKHQNFDKIEARNDYMRNYMKDYRDKQKLIASGKEQTEHKANSKVNSKSNVNSLEEIRLDKKRKEKGFDANAVELPECLKTDAFREAWVLWQQHRKEKKNPLTPTATKQQLKKLEEMGEARAVAAIKHSIAGGYAGIFEPKNGATQGLFPDDPSRPPGAVRKTASGWWLDKDGAVIMKPEFS